MKSKIPGTSGMSHTVATAAPTTRKWYDLEEAVMCGTYVGRGTAG